LQNFPNPGNPLKKATDFFQYIIFIKCSAYIFFELGALLIQLRYCKISNFHLCSFSPEVNSGQALMKKNQKSRLILNDTHPFDDKMRLFRLLGVGNARL